MDTLRWFSSDACHAFHVMNAWDDGNAIAACVMQSDTAPGLPDAEGRLGNPDAMAARLHRWTFGMGGTGSGFQRERLDDLVAEFPRIDDRYTGLRNRHGFYTCHATSRARDDSESVLYDSLARFDFDMRSLHSLPQGDIVSEPVFVPRASDAAEGDGWLLAVAWRSGENRSDLLVLDAMNLAGGPVAVARLLHRCALRVSRNLAAQHEACQRGQGARRQLLKVSSDRHLRESTLSFMMLNLRARPP